jgi:Dolichyl-phosphate-mannose-protein mannosyltransferase
MVHTISVAKEMDRVVLIRSNASTTLPAQPVVGPAIPYVAGFGVGAVLLSLAAAGYSDSDDHFYIEAADGWLAHMPFVGTTHWHLRHPFVLAIAASFAAFGRTELALMLPTLLAYVSILLLTIWMVRSVADNTAAALAAIFVASVPVFVIYARTPFPDEIEVMLVLLSLFLFRRGIEHGRTAFFVLSGAVVGISWLLRASCLPLIALYGVLFVIGWRSARSLYMWLIVGFAPLLLGEWVFFWATTDDPFYRLRVDVHSLEIPSAFMIGGVAGGLRPPFNLTLMAKWLPNSIHVHWLVDPYLGFLINGSYGPIFWTGIPGAVVMCSCLQQSPTRDFSRLICTLAVLWIIIEVWVLNLAAQPRYFGPVTWMAAVMTALWLRQMVPTKRSWIIATTAMILATNLLAISLRPDPVRAERVLAAYAARSPDSLWTNLSRGAFLQDELGVADRVHIALSTQVPPGGLYVVTRPDAISLGIAGWREVFCDPAKPPLLLRPLALLDRFSPRLAALIRRGNADVVVLRAPLDRKQMDWNIPAVASQAPG